MTGPYTGDRLEAAHSSGLDPGMARDQCIPIIDHDRNQEAKFVDRPTELLDLLLGMEA